MRGVLLAVACAAALTTAASVSARPSTTNEPAIMTVKVTVTDGAVTLSPDHAARGSVVTFILTNRGKATRTFQIGDVRRGVGYGEGFARTLKPNQQRTIVMYLNYRGKMSYFSRSGARTLARGVFRIT